MPQIALETLSTNSNEKVIEKAREYFINQFGLELQEETDCCLRAEGGGGHIFIRTESAGKNTSVILEGREWTRQLKFFMQKISG